MSSWAEEDDGTVYTDVHDWVSDWLAPHYRRSFDTGSLVWCAQWWEHEEAVSRLTGLWRAWEALVPKDKSTGLATFWINFADPMMAALTADAGVFKACAREHSTRLQPLPTGTAQP